jgi:hypothetical protein
LTVQRKPRKSTALVSRSREVHDGEIVDEKPISRLPRARTPEAREQQLVALSYDLAEKQIIEGTVSSQVLTHFLKIGSSREKAELEKLKQETILTEAKVKDLANVEDMKKLYSEAMDAMRGYSGQEIGYDENQNIF